MDSHHITQGNLKNQGNQKVHQKYRKLFASWWILIINKFIEFFLEISDFFALTPLKVMFENSAFTWFYDRFRFSWKDFHVIFCWTWFTSHTLFIFTNVICFLRSQGDPARHDNQGAQSRHGATHHTTGGGAQKDTDRAPAEKQTGQLNSWERDYDIIYINKEETQNLTFCTQHFCVISQNHMAIKYIVCIFWADIQ